MAGKLNIDEFNKEILSNKSVIELIDNYAKEILKEAKDEMIEEFNSHPVTKEIEAGEDATNDTHTLDGYGNLFSFIGFEQNSKPIEEVRKLFEKINLSGSKKIQGNKISYDFNMPTDEEIKAVTKMPWETGRSWFFDIEKTISGLGYYLFKKSKKSRSGNAIEVENQIRSVNFSPIRYFSIIKENFKRKLNYK